MKLGGEDIHNAKCECGEKAVFFTHYGSLCEDCYFFQHAGGFYDEDDETCDLKPVQPVNRKKRKDHK